MSWNERQRRMLAAMGIRMWTPAAAEAPRHVPVPAEAGPEESLSGSGAPDAAAASVAAARAVEVAAPLEAASTASAMRASVVPTSPAANASIAHERPPVAAASIEADLPERAGVIATLAWTPLREAVAACTACGLSGSRRQTVFGVGHPLAEWMIVGEAPGEQEDLAGEPFVGPAGQLLDQMLRALGLSRLHEPSAGRELKADARGLGDRPVDDAEGDPARRVFIANTLKCRPPRNRNPEPEELARCEPFLRRQVALVQPRVILLMGRFAVKTLLKSDEAIGRLRGRLHRYEGIPVIVTYHPAYLLRNLPDKARAWEDLCFAAATMAGLRAQAAA